MRSFLTYGAISLVGIAALYACGDDSGDGTGAGGAAGSGGTAGAGGGTAGTVGMAGVGGSGVAGTAGTGSVTPPTPMSNCNGCVQLTVPIPATPVNTQYMHSQASFVFSAAATGAPYDLTNVTSITWRVQALTTNANYYVQPYLQNRPPEDSTYKGDYGEMAVALTPAAFPANGWVDILVNVAAQPGPAGASNPDAGAGDAGTADAGADASVPAAPAGTLAAFDKSKTRYVGLNVGANAAAGAGLVSVEVDSVTVVGTGVSTFTTQTFDTTNGGMILETFEAPPGTSMPTFH